jgi:hypothetical protein
MKKYLLTMIAVLAVAAMASAQKTDNNSVPETVEANRVYRVFAYSNTDPDVIQSQNERIGRQSREGERDERGLLTGLGLAIAKSYGTVLVQKSTTALSNLISMAIRLAQKNKRDREEWLKTANQQCHFQHRLSSDIFIDDFYYLPSNNGALDPMNMKFTGFGCKSSLRPVTLSHEKGIGRNDTLSIDKQGQKDTQMVSDSTELLEFFFTCKLRNDSVGLSRIVNHSKFEVEIDQLVFDARHSCLPNDSVLGQKLQPFDFKGRKEFVFNLNVKVFSSWVNEAIMLFDNQQIGEFNITARIDSGDLSEDYLFVYDPEKHGDKVSVTGECFLVPRSYTGTATSPSWGTGQYRLEVTIHEDCQVNEKWYQKEKKGGGQAKGKRPQWDNRKWKPEWKEMKSQNNSKEAWNMVWQSVTTAYIGNDWVQELVSPLTSAVSTHETVALGNLLERASSAGKANPKRATVPASAIAPMPKAGEKP